MTDLHILLEPVSDFWKCPKKVFFVCIFYHILLTHLVLSDPLNFFKSSRILHECRPVYGLYFVYIDFCLSFIQIKGVLGVQNVVFMSLLQFLAILTIKMAVFFKLAQFKTILKTRTMMDLHILLDLVTNFWKCPKKFFCSPKNWIHKNSI